VLRRRSPLGGVEAGDLLPVIAVAGDERLDVRERLLSPA
jgi:hypothetical protein